MWKKKIAVLMAAAMITGMSGLTVFAEEGSQVPQQVTQGEAPQPPQMEQQAPQGEAPTGQPPQMGQQAPKGEAPQKGQQSSQDETPQAPEGEAPTGQAPQGEAPQVPQGEAPTDMEGQVPQGEASQNGQQAPQGEAPRMGQQPSQGDEAPQMEQKHPGRGRHKMDHGQEPQGDKGRASQNQTPQGNEHRKPFIDFEACVKEGTISQETCDAIKKYMDENKPSTTSGESSEAKDGEKPDLLKDLLDAEVITQDEYDALAKRTADVKGAIAPDDKATCQSV